MEDEKTIWIDEAELTDERVSPFRKGYLRIILGPTDEDIARIEDKLKALGVTMTDPRPLDAPAADGESIDVVSKYSFDDTMMRVIAKIAFNYATWVAGADFMLGSDFDALRGFVRHGDKVRWDPVAPMAEPILSDETNNWRRSKLHLLTVRWNETTKSLLGQVSFFNKFNYWIALCYGYEGVWRPVHQGHSFSLISRKVQPLASRG